VLLWFVVCSAVIVALVFRSPAIDHRTVVLGAVLPLVEALLGGPRVLHSVVGAVAILAVVMLTTRHSRLVRRRLLGIPIGLMCHLVLDGSFTRTDVFWWPVTGLDFAPGQVPELDHLGLSLVLELAAVGVGLWARRLFSLDDPERREQLIRTGRLDLPA
jgi:membrane-bound metal-dependent hydrolase YbcI (DUF457 family)